MYQLAAVPARPCRSSRWRQRRATARCARCRISRRSWNRLPSDIKSLLSRKQWTFSCPPLPRRLSSSSFPSSSWMPTCRRCTTYAACRPAALNLRCVVIWPLWRHRERWVYGRGILDNEFMTAFLQQITIVSGVKDCLLCSACGSPWITYDTSLLKLNVNWEWNRQ